MNVNGVTFTTTCQNLYLHGPIDHQLLAMITMPVRSWMSAKMVSAKVSNIPVKGPIRSPVVFKVLSVLAMEHADISLKQMEQYVGQLLTSAISQKGKK